MNKNQVYKREISAEIKEKWQNIVDIIVKTVGSSDALITRLDSPFLEVFKASNNAENSFSEGKREKLSGHFCEEVIKHDQKLIVSNALKNEKWKDSLEIKAGFKAYLGYPLKWPDGKIFGTLCIHDKKAHDFSEHTQQIMKQFKELIESHLKTIKNIQLIQRDNEIIQEQKNRLKLIIEGTDVGTWEWNIQRGDVIFDNKWSDLLGYTLEELKPTTIETWKKLTHPEDLKKVEIELEKTFKRETENYDVEIRMKHKDGHWVWINGRGRIISWTEKDQPLKMLGIHLDITERKEQEEELEFQYRVQKIMTEISSSFSNINSGEFDLKVNMVLKRIGEFFGVDRAYIFHVAEKDNKLINSHGWVSEKEEFQKGEFENIAADFLHLWKEELTAGKIINIQDIEKMGSREAAAKKLLRGKNIRSIVVIPMFIEHKLFGFLGFDSVRERRIFSEHDLELLNVITGHLSQAFSKSIQEEKIKALNQKLKKEINKTAEVHENNFLESVPNYKNISLATYYSPAEIVGGDFYNFIELDNKLLFYLSDITGHNLEGIVFNSFIKETINNYVELIEKPIKIDKLMEYLHKQYLKNNFPDDYFVCLFIGFLDLESLKMEYISQGFQFPPLLNSSHNSQNHLPGLGMPISSAIPEELINYKINNYHLKSKDSIIFYTDGIVEQKQHDIYYERFKETFYKFDHLSAEEIKLKILADFKEFNDGSLKGDDDITFFIIKINN